MQPKQAPLSIGDLAKAADCQVQTIRYYEQIGILRKVARTGGGHRVYSADDLQRLRFVRRSRDLGFSLDAVRELLHLADNREDDCNSVDKITMQQLAEVREKLAQLTALERELKRMVTGCRRGKIADCRIVQALSSADEDLRRRK
jgi:DNA-binding transcriptional MerR regulator